MEGYSSKNYVRKFLRALHPKWRAKVTAIEKSRKILHPLSLDELMENLKVYEDDHQERSQNSQRKRLKGISCFKAKKETSDEDCPTPVVKMKSYAMDGITSRSSLR
ncbi:hypothetical protein Tco_0891614 [Tanacetum coccineum]|uniref:UBN2 domain-containing protein n=1 Tax=Tanacetum coccineum TaxID=301880 RepID=A0ABQ5C6C2_9ASTR